MKRQRNVAGSRTVAARARKAKREVGVEKEKDKEKDKEKTGKVVEEMKDSEKCVAVEAEVLVEDEVEVEERPRLWSLADEQMSWGSFWCPSWDIDHLGTEAYNALYSDVVWDDDLWDLKGIKEVPNP